MCKTFTQGSYLTNHQIIHTREILTSVCNVARLLGAALNSGFIKYFILRNAMTMAVFNYYVGIYILETSHINVFLGRNFLKQSNALQMQSEWKKFPLKLKYYTVRVHIVEKS